MPNPNTIPYWRYQDIQISDVTLQQQFVQYMNSGQYTEALSLLTTNEEQLQGKAYIANAINIIINAIMDLENYYHTGVTIFLSNLAIQYNTLVSNLRNRSTWNSNIQYTPYNFVTYNQEVYMCIEQPPVGTLPTNINYWLYVGLRGNQGDPGVDVTMRYGWSGQTIYSPNDLVVYNNNIYVALVANTGVAPSTNPSTWLLFLQIDKGEINVGTVAPSNPADNTIWFQTQTDPSQATTTDPIIGQFKYYIEEQGIWDELYPNTLFSWVANATNYQPPLFSTQQTIATTDWVSNQWTYTYANLTEQSVVDILPVAGMSSAQIDLYNSLFISITRTAITLTAGITPTVQLSVIIQIM